MMGLCRWLHVLLEFLEHLIRQHPAAGPMHSGINFINILRKKILYECHFGSFFYVQVTREKLPKQCLYEKIVHKC